MRVWLVVVLLFACEDPMGRFARHAANAATLAPTRTLKTTHAIAATNVRPSTDPSPGARGARTVPEKWRPADRRCTRRGRRRFCDGPRRAPVSVGIARVRARRLGLGVLRTAADLIRDSPRPEWMEELKVLGLTPPQELVWPIDGGHFGRGLKGRAPRFRVHRGVDVSAEVGTPVHVLADGLVAYADNGVSGYGNLVVVLHGGGEVSAYAHLRSIEVMTGAVVRAGDQVAHSGNTGLSRGPHLHFEWRERGEVADPMRRFPAQQPRWMRDLFAARPLRARRQAKPH